MRECKMCNKEYELSESGAGYKYCSQNCSDEARRIRNRERWREANPGWDEGINKVCEWCGKSFTTPARNAHQARFCSNKCRDTYHSRRKGFRPMEEREEEWEEIREQKRQELIKNWSIQDWGYIGGYIKGNSDIQMKCIHCNTVVVVDIDNIVGRKTYECTPECIEDIKHKQEQEKRLKKKEEWQALPVKECTICGREFKSWQPDQVTCSKECRRKHSNRKRKALDKANKSKVRVIDNDITVEGLYERDNGICHICNSECNFDDYEIIKNAFIVGKTYPSIDHLKPRSKGGVHSWKNVKLAHHYCNTIKNDNENREEVIERINELIG